MPTDELPPAADVSVRCTKENETMATDVFVSVGRASTPSQEAFIVAVEDLLRTKGFSLRRCGPN